MLKCLNQDTSEFITILDPRWKVQLNSLRQLDDQDRLLCPLCRQPVRLRTGNIRVWHFAHKHLQNCPLQLESLLLLQTRAAIYEWLLNYYPAEKVSVEKVIADLPFPRHIDCWVEQEPNSMLYWIFDTRRPPRERTQLQQTFEASTFHAHPVFTNTMLHPDKFDPQHIFLSTTERAFMTASQYDQTICGYTFSQGKTLHYLDAENQNVLTYRNSHLIHSPQEYSGYLIKSPLAEIKPSPGEGEFAHPGEEQKLQKILLKNRALFEKQQRTIPNLLKRQPVPPDKEPLSNLPTFLSATPVNQVNEYNPFNRIATCLVCKNSTVDWITYDGKTGTCLCRDCYNKQILE